MVAICQAQQNEHDSVTEIAEIWQKLLKTISSNNTIKFKELSGATIKCYDCLENTDKERIAITQLRENDSTWYKHIYEDMIFVPIVDFITEDFDLIFTTEFVKILNTKKAIFLENSSVNFEVLLTTIESSEEFEGMQHVFEFKKIENQWKFIQLSTIP